MTTAERFDPALLEKNLAALETRDGRLARILRETAADAAVSVTLARNGEPTLSIDGRSILSRYEPARDIERLLEQEPAGGSPRRVVLVLGFELGYLALGLWRKINGKVFVIEPRPAVLRAALGAVDCAAALADHRLTVVDAVDKLFFQFEYGVKMQPNLGLYLLPPIRQLYADQLEPLRRRIETMKQDQKIITATNLKRQIEWFDNLIDNFPVYSRHAPLARLDGALAGRPAVVVSAGPSLDKNSACLARWQNRGVILSVGTALRKCTAAGAIPDLTLAVESNDITPQFADAPETARAYLALLVKCHRRLWDLPAKGIFYFGNDMPDANWLLSLIGQPDAVLDFSGSVSIAAFSLAVRLGCNPIVIVGQDLAFGEAGQSHAAGVSQIGDFSLDSGAMQNLAAGQGPDADEYLQVEGYYGGRVLTKINLYNYLLWYEKHLPAIVARGIRVINATEGGARIRDAETMPFAVATEKFLGAEFPVQERLDACYRPAPIDRAALRERLDGTAADLRELQHCAKNGLARTAEIFRLLNRPNRPAAQIDQLLARLEKDEARLKTLAARHDDLLTAVGGKELLVVNTAFDYQGLSVVESLRRNMQHTASMYDGLRRITEMLLEKTGRFRGYVATDAE